MWYDRERIGNRIFGTSTLQNNKNYFTTPASSANSWNSLNLSQNFLTFSNVADDLYQTCYSKKVYLWSLLICSWSFPLKSCSHFWIFFSEWGAEDRVTVYTSTHIDLSVLNQPASHQHIPKNFKKLKIFLICWRLLKFKV